MGYFAGDPKDSLRLLQKKGGIGRGAGKGVGGRPPGGGLPAGMVLWFDPSDAATYTLSGSNVTGFTCKASGKTWSQADAAKQPLLDTTKTRLKQNCFNFENGGSAASSKSLAGTAIAIGPPFTAFMVLNRVATAAYLGTCLQVGTAANTLSAGGGLALYQFSTSPTIKRSVQIGVGAGYSYYNGNLSDPAPETNISTWIVPTTAFNAVAIEWNNVGITETSGAGTGIPASNNFSCLGSTDSTYLSRGYLGEVLVYPSALSAADRTRVYNYLYSKWVI